MKTSLAIAGLVLLMMFPALYGIGMEMKLASLGFVGIVCFPAGLLLLAIADPR